MITTDLREFITFYYVVPSNGLSRRVNTRKASNSYDRNDGTNG